MESPRPTTTETSTTRTKSRKAVKGETLECWRISRELSDDPIRPRLDFEKWAEYRSDRIEVEHLESLHEILEEHSQKIKKVLEERIPKNGFDYYNALRKAVNLWRPGPEKHRRFAPMSDADFDWDKNNCSYPSSNEADLQRTLMMSVIDRFDFQNTFTFTCEDQWKKNEQFSILASSTSDELTRPKPDLALSFERGAIRGDLRWPTYPADLADCLRPGQADHIWFPFFFMEAKRRDDSLLAASIKNLVSASQALFNIYQWMRRCSSELAERFFADVRVFTMDINVGTMVLRIHRAELSPEGIVAFEHDQIAQVHDYSCSQICHVVKRVLLDYAEPTLLPILQETFRLVSALPQSADKGKKRKGRLRDADEERAEHRNLSQDTIRPERAGVTGASFDTERLDITSTERPKRGRTGGGRTGRGRTRGVT